MKCIKSGFIVPKYQIFRLKGINHALVIVFLGDRGIGWVVHKLTSEIICFLYSIFILQNAFNFFFKKLTTVKY